MRFVKTAIFALAFAAMSIFGAGIAQALPVEVTSEVVACAEASTEVSAETKAALSASEEGATVDLSAEAVAELKAAGCLDAGLGVE